VHEGEEKLRKYTWQDRSDIDKNHRYLLFECPTYYPSGGMDDLRASGDDLEELKVYAQDDDEFNWGGRIHIFDMVERRVVWQRKY
jgi:hypothetical protein